MACQGRTPGHEYRRVDMESDTSSSTKHGLVDLAAYDAYLSGKLTKYELPQEEIERSLNLIAGLPKP